MRLKSSSSSFARRSLDLTVATSSGLILQICLIIALSLDCRFVLVSGQVSLAKSMVLHTQELYTWPQVFFFLSLFTGSLILEHYTRGCKFGNFDKIKKQKQHKKTKQHNTKNFWLNFCLNKECPKLLCGLGVCHRRRQTILMWNSSGVKEFFRASLYVWCLRY